MNNPYSRRACLPGNEVTQAVITESDVQNDELAINTSEDSIPSRQDNNYWSTEAKR